MACVAVPRRGGMKGEMRRGLPSPKIMVVGVCLLKGEEAWSAIFTVLLFLWGEAASRNYPVDRVMWIMYVASCSARHEWECR